MSKCPAKKVCVGHVIGENLANNTLFFMDIRTLDIVEGHMSNLGDVIKVIGTTKDVKWYSMLECEAQIEDATRRVHLPACFLKQIGVKFDSDDRINDDDFMLTFEKYNKPKFIQCLPHKPQYISAGKTRVKNYFEPLLPKNYKTSASVKRDKFYKQLYYIIRIASCSCVLSCVEKRNIEGIKDICNSTLEWRYHGMKFSNIEDAVLDQGKIIGPLQGTYHFTGWKIISMIYSMLWCNSDIHHNPNEVFSIIKILSSVDSYVQLLIPQENDFLKIIVLLKTIIHTPELSKEGWVIVFLYIRNYYWCMDYVSNASFLVKTPKYPDGTFEKLRAVTEKWKMEKDDDFMKNIKKLSSEEFDWISELLLGTGDRINASKDRYAKIKTLKEELKHMILPFGSTAYRAILLQVLQHNDDSVEYTKLQEQLNIGVMICVEMMLYNSFSKIEIPSCNKLDFVRKAGHFDSHTRGKFQHSVLKLSKGMGAEVEHRRESDWDEFLQYEKMYSVLTGPIKAAITTNKDINEMYAFCCKCWFDLQKQMRILLQYMSVNNIEYLKIWGYYL